MCVRGGGGNSFLAIYPPLIKHTRAFFNPTYQHHIIYNIIDNENWRSSMIPTLSIMSGLVVAATTSTSLKCSTPSISVSSCASTRSATADPSLCEERGRREGGEGKRKHKKRGKRREDYKKAEEKARGLYLFLCTARASISSKKIMAGAALLALPNTCRTALSESPTHLLNNSGPWGKQYVSSRETA